MRVLDGTNTCRPGHESSTRSAQLISRWGLLRESVPGSAHWWWGGLDGDVVGSLWIFFLGGEGDGKRRRQDTFIMVCFFDRRREFPNTRVVLNITCLSAMSWTDTWCSSFDNLTTSSTYWRQWRASCTSFRHGLHGTVGMVFYAHVVYVTCYFCYMFSLETSSGSSVSIRIYRRVIFGKQNWWSVWMTCT